MSRSLKTILASLVLAGLLVGCEGRGFSIKSCKDCNISEDIVESAIKIYDWHVIRSEGNTKYYGFGNLKILDKSNLDNFNYTLFRAESGEFILKLGGGGMICLGLSMKTADF